MFNPKKYSNVDTGVYLIWCYSSEGSIYKDHATSARTTFQPEEQIRLQVFEMLVIGMVMEREKSVLPLVQPQDRWVKSWIISNSIAFGSYNGGSTGVQHRN